MIGSLRAPIPDPPIPEISGPLGSIFPGAPGVTQRTVSFAAVHDTRVREPTHSRSLCWKMISGILVFHSRAPDARCRGVAPGATGRPQPVREVRGRRGSCYDATV